MSFSYTKQTLIFLAVFLILAGLTLFTPVFITNAQEVNYDWAVVEEAGELSIRADTSEYAADHESIESYEWQLVRDGTGEVITEISSSAPVLFLSTADVEPGFTHRLEVTFVERRVGSTPDVAGSLLDTVALPRLNIETECVPDFGSGTVEARLNILPGGSDFFPNLNNPTFEFYNVYADGRRSYEDRDTEAPYRSTGGLLDVSQEVEVSFSGSDIVLEESVYEAGTYPRNCREVEANFGYSVDGLTVSTEVLSPFGEYNHRWEFDDGNDVNGIEYTTTSLEAVHTFSSGGTKRVSLIAEGKEGSGNETVQLNRTLSYIGDYDFSDEDGDGVHDDEEVEEENEPERPNPAAVVEEGGLVNCGQANADGEISNWCDWQDFIALINDLITWLIGIATIVATLFFMYAGFLYLTSGGSQEQAKRARGIFTNVAVGFGIILLAWLIVTTVVSLLTGEDWIRDNSELLPISAQATVIIEPLS